MAYDWQYALLDAALSVGCLFLLGDDREAVRYLT